MDQSAHQLSAFLPQASSAKPSGPQNSKMYVAAQNGSSRNLVQPGF